MNLPFTYSSGVSYTIPEFPSQALDSLRQPLETGEVAIVRAISARSIRPASNSLQR